MSLKLNFFPLHFIVSLLLLVSMCIIFSDTIYIYMSSNIYVNGLIITLFVFCMLWILGVLSYYSRSTKVLNRLLAIINPNQKTETDVAKLRKQALYVASSVAGTLIDSPIVSRVLSSSIRTGRLDVNFADAASVVDAVKENGDRILGASKFLTSIFTMLGLFGTFVGLLQTIDGVGRALASLSNVANIDILGFVKLLADPLQGMSVAFSTSLFGLVASLYGNYGNYVAKQKLEILAFKLRNFLAASSAVVVSDPNKIEAKDILMSLDESFNKLYTGLVDRLDTVSDGIFAMSKAIVRTQERQEKILRVIVDHFFAIEALWEKFPALVGYVKKLSNVSVEINASLEQHRKEMVKFYEKSVVSTLMRMEDELVDQTNLSKDISNISLDTAKFAKNTTDELRQSNAILTDNTAVAHQDLEVSRDLARLSSDSNGLATGILNASADQVEILSESSNKLSGVISELGLVASIGEAIDQKAAEANNSLNYIASQATEINTGVAQTNGLLDMNNNILGSIAGSASEIAEISGAIYNKLSSETTPAISAILGEIGGTNGLLSSVVEELSQIINISNEVLNRIPNEAIQAIASEASMANQIKSAIYDEINGITTLASQILSTGQTGTSSLESILEQVTQIGELSGNISQNIAFVAESSAETAGNTSGLIESAYSIDQNISTLNEGVYASLEMSEGLLSTVQENTSYLQETVSSSARVADSVENLSNTVMEMGEVVTYAMTNLSDLSISARYDMDILASSFSDFKDRMEVVVDGFQSNMEILADVSNVALSLETSIVDLTGALQIAAPAMEGLITVTDESNQYMGTLLDSIYGVGEVASMINEGVTYISDNLVPQLDAIDASLVENNSLSSEILTAVADAAEREFSLSGSMEAMVAEFADLKMEYTAELQTLNDYMSESLDTIMGSFDYIAQNTNDMGSLVDRVDAFVGEYGDTASRQENTLQDISETLQDNISLTSDLSREVSDRLASFDDSLNEQTVILDNVDANISSIDEYRNGFLDDVSAQYSDLQNTVTQLTQSLSETSVDLGGVSDAIVRQADISEDMVSNLSDLANIADSIRTTADNIDYAADTFSNVSDVMSQLENMSYAQEDTFKEFSSKLSGDVSILSDVFDRLGNLLENRKDVPDLYDETVRLVDEVTNFSRSFEDFANRVVDNSEGMSSDVYSALNNLVDDVSDIKNSVANVFSDQLVRSISELSNTQGDLADRANEIVPLLIEGLENMRNTGGGEAFSSQAAAALEDLRQEQQNGNMRLDVVANAVDSLITEMLNSRDVAQSILRVVSELGNILKR